jgi:hypothetical protein
MCMVSLTAPQLILAFSAQWMLGVFPQLCLKAYQSRILMTSDIAVTMFGKVQVVVTRRNGWLMLFKNGTLFNYTMGENAAPPAVPLVVEGVAQLVVSQRSDPIQMLVRFNNGSLLVREAFHL